MDISREKAIERLASLSKRQYDALVLRCQGMKFQEIADKQNVALGTFKKRMADVYVKLSLDGLERNQRSKLLFEIYCPLLNEYPKQSELDPEEEDQDSEGDISPEIEKMLDEDDEFPPIFTPTPEDIFPPETQPPGGSWSRAILFILIGIIIGGIAIYVLLTQILAGQEQLTSQTDEPGVTVVTEVHEAEVTRIVTSTPEALQPTQTARIEEKIVVVTATSPPATDTPEVPLTNPPEFTFFDDFEDGPDPAWEVKYGEVGMANGKYLVTAPFSGKNADHLSILTRKTWGNVSITFQLAPFQMRYVNFPRDTIGALILRYQENGEGVGVLFYPRQEGIEFGTLSQTGEWTILGSSLVNGREKNFDLSDGNNEIRVEAIGNTYLVYVNDKQVNSAAIPGPETGEMGFWFQSGSADDDAEIYSPRIEEIQIESME